MGHTVLLVEIEQARAENNNVRVEQLERDMAVIVGKISESVGIGGRLKKSGDKRKNIRDSFRNNVNRVIDKQITQTDPDLATHLKKAIIFGNDPRYVPQDGMSWETRPVKND